MSRLLSLRRSSFLPLFFLAPFANEIPLRKQGDFVQLIEGPMLSQFESMGPCQLSAVRDIFTTENFMLKIALSSALQLFYCNIRS